MIKLNTTQLAEILNARLIGDGTVKVENVGTDTRKAIRSGLFFALKGERFDGHDYIQAVQAQGYTAAVTEQECDVAVPQLVVKDTRLALGLLAQWLKAKINPKTVAITGSSGKTTVKEMTAAILQQSAVDPDAVLFTRGNFNNDIGVPLTLLRLTEKHKFAVIELGANHVGEIAYTTELVRPNVALVNNVAAAHLEGFGSIEGVAWAKGEIYRGLNEFGTAIINLDCHYPELWREEIGTRKVRSFSTTNSQADYYADNIQSGETGSRFILHSPKGWTEIRLPYLGGHNIANALAAAALAMGVGAELWEVKRGLEQKTQMKGRLFPIQPHEHLLLLDDTYNANVDSMQSAIRVLQKYSAFRILVVGDMGELGENSQLCHRQVAQAAERAKLDIVASFGDESRIISEHCNGRHFTDKAALSAYLMMIIKQKLQDQQKVVLLAKGSRRMKMEEVIDSLKDSFVC